MNNVSVNTDATGVFNGSTPEPVLGFDSVEFQVGNAFQAAHYFRSTLGFRIRQSSGLDTGCEDATSYLLTQGRIELIVTSPLHAGQVPDHGDRVRDVALLVGNVEDAFTRAVGAGARPVRPPSMVDGAAGSSRRATVETPGHLLHSLVERSPGAQFYLPAGRDYAGRTAASPVGLGEVDHVAIAVESGRLDAWTSFYQSAFGLTITHSETTSTGMTAMRSAVVQNAAGTVKFTVVEPAPARKRSQIEDFVIYNGGAGVQHVAFLCSDICGTLRMLGSRGIDLLHVPDAYYDALPARLGVSGQEVEDLRRVRALVDRDEWGVLIQAFSKPITGRPTLFLEFVQRDGARGFGSGNIRALFEAIEREQAARLGW